MESSLNPRSISQIHSSIGAKWFRIRDVTTLRDYLVLEFSQIGFVSSDPKWAQVVCLNDRLHGTLDCVIKKYALLSSIDEMTMYRRYKRTAVEEEVLKSYGKARAAGKF